MNDQPVTRWILDIAIASGLSPERAAAVAQEVSLTELRNHRAAEDLSTQLFAMVRAWRKKWRLGPREHLLILVPAVLAVASTLLAGMADDATPAAPESTDG